MEGETAAVERVFREEYGRLIASLVRRFGDIDVAEEAAGEALVAALEKWPESGVPPNPGGWLTTTATVVDGTGETPVVTDGPYLETKEVIGGFWVIDAPDLDVALKLAAEGSKACRGKVEVRPFDGLA